jgi:superfamily II DNA/RNA helicase
MVLDNFRGGSRRQALLDILDSLRGEGDGGAALPIPKTIIFTNRKDDCELLFDHLMDAGYSPVVLHGDKTQAMRDDVMRTFRNGKKRILIATDVASRGLDVEVITISFLSQRY